MRNVKNRVLQWIGVLLILSQTNLSPEARAGGLAVIDIANVKQTTITAIESVEQTLKQIEEYK